MLPEPELPMADAPVDDMEMSDTSELMPSDIDTVEEKVNFKVIQKLTGKLTQKIRTLDNEEGMTSEDVKYVINMVLSALDLTSLSEEDKEDIMAKFEEDETVSYNIYSKSDVDCELGVELTDEQWLRFLHLWENDDVLNEVRAETWMQTVEAVRQEFGIEEGE